MTYTGTYTVIDTMTGEIVGNAEWYIPSGPSNRQREALAAAKAMAFSHREKQLAVQVAAKGKAISACRIEEKAEGRFLVKETGERFSVIASTYIPKLNTVEHYDSRQRNGRGEWVGPRG